MYMTTLKITTTSLLILAFSAGSAFAGDGKDCKHKKNRYPENANHGYTANICIINCGATKCYG